MFGFTRTSWETSWYGGVARVLSEYPYLTTSYDVYHTIEKDCKMDLELSYYHQQKMINIMFYESFKNLKFKETFVKHMTSDYKAIISDPERLKESLVKADYFTAKEKVKIPVSKVLIELFINHCKEDSELKPIFKQYAHNLLSKGSEIYVLLDPPSEAPPKSDPGKGSSGKSEDQEEWAENETNKAKKKFAKISDSYKDKSKIEEFKVEVIEMRKTSSSHINSEQMQFAKKIFNLLDITQDPKADIVKNLFQGKIDDEKLSEVLAGNNRIHMKTVENQSLKPFKIVILGDLSGSMDYGGRIEFQRKVLKSFYYLFNDLLKITDLEIYGHSGEDQPILYKYHTPDYPYFLETIEKRVPYQENYDGPIIQEIHKMVRKDSDKPVLFISLSDGEPSGNSYGGAQAVAKMQQIMEKAKRDNFVTVGIGIQHGGVKGLYQYGITIHDFNKIHPIAQLLNKAVKENLVSE